MRIMAFCRLPRNGEHTKAGVFRREFVCHTLPAVRGKGFSFPVKDLLREGPNIGLLQSLRKSR